MAAPVGPSETVISFDPSPLTQRTARSDAAQRQAAQNGQTKPFERLFTTSSKEVDPTCIVLAVQYGHSSLLKLFMKEKVPFPPERFQEALEQAVALDQIECIRLLVESVPFNLPLLVDLMLKLAPRSEDKTVRATVDSIISSLREQHADTVITRDHLDTACAAGVSSLRALLAVGPRFSAEDLKAQLSRRLPNTPLARLLLRQFLPDEAEQRDDEEEPLRQLTLGVGAMGGDDPDFPLTARVAGEDDDDLIVSARRTAPSLVTPRAREKPTLLAMLDPSLPIPEEQLRLVKQGDRTPFTKLKTQVHPGCVVLAARHGPPKLLSYFMTKGYDIPDGIFREALMAAMESVSGIGHPTDLLQQLLKHEFPPRFLVSRTIEAACLGQIDVVEILVPHVKKGGGHRYITGDDLAVASLCGFYSLTVLLNQDSSSLGGAFDQSLLLQFLQEAVNTSNVLLTDILAGKVLQQSLRKINISAADLRVVIKLVDAGMEVSRELFERAAVGGSIPFFECCAKKHILIPPTCLLRAVEHDQDELALWFLETKIIPTLMGGKKGVADSSQHIAYTQAYHHAISAIARSGDIERLTALFSKNGPSLLGYDISPLISTTETPLLTYIVMFGGAPVTRHHLACAVECKRADLVSMLGKKLVAKGIPGSTFVLLLMAAVKAGDVDTVRSLIEDMRVCPTFLMIQEAATRGYTDVTTLLIWALYPPSEGSHPQKPEEGVIGLDPETVWQALRHEPHLRVRLPPDIPELLFLYAYAGNLAGVEHALRQGVRITAATVYVAMLRRHTVVVDLLWPAYRLQSAEDQKAEREKQQRLLQAERQTYEEDVLIQTRAIMAAAGGGSAAGAAAAPTRARRPSVNGKTEWIDDDDDTPLTFPTVPAVRKKRGETADQYYKAAGEKRLAIVQNIGDFGKRLQDLAAAEAQRPLGATWIRDAGPDPQFITEVAALAQRLQRTVDLFRQGRRLPPERVYVRALPNFPSNLIDQTLTDSLSDIRTLPDSESLRYLLVILGYSGKKELADLLLDVLPKMEQSEIDETHLADDETSQDEEGEMPLAAGTTLQEEEADRTPQLNIPPEALWIALCQGHVQVAQEMARNAKPYPLVDFIKDPSDISFARLVNNVADQATTLAVAALLPHQVVTYLSLQKFPPSPELLELLMFQGRTDLLEKVMPFASPEDPFTFILQDRRLDQLLTIPPMGQDDLNRLLRAAIHVKSFSRIDWLLKQKGVKPSCTTICFAALQGDPELLKTLFLWAPLTTTYDLAYHFKISATDRSPFLHPALVSRIQQLPTPTSDLIRSYVVPRLPNSVSLRRPPTRLRVGVHASMQPLQAAAAAGNETDFRTFLGHKEYPPNVLQQCLYAAAQAGSLPIVQCLVEDKKVPLDFETVDAALQEGRFSIFEYLIRRSEAQTNPSLVIFNPDMPEVALKALIAGPRVVDETQIGNCLIAAAHRGSITLIDVILKTKQCPVIAAAIERAVLARNERAAHLLIEKAEPLNLTLSAPKGDLDAVRGFMKQKPSPQELEAALFLALFVAHYTAFAPEDLPARAEAVVRYLVNKKVPITARMVRLGTLGGNEGLKNLIMENASTAVVMEIARDSI
jgi:hypothetical protein